MRLRRCKVTRPGSVVTAWMKFIHVVNWRSEPVVVSKDSSTNFLPWASALGCDTPCQDEGRRVQLIAFTMRATCSACHRLERIAA